MPARAISDHMLSDDMLNQTEIATIEMNMLKL